MRMKMTGLPMPRGTWLVLVVAVIPVLVSQVASAAPGYPVEDPADTSYVVAYDPPSQVLTVTSSTPASPDVVVGTTVLPEDLGTDAVVSGVVGGPNGQINHGQVVKEVHELTDGPTSGCLTSAVARSDLGMGEHESTADDLDSVALNVDCSKTNGTDASDKAPGNPDKSDKAPGKSDKAPGKQDK
jgi:hypothetical protein